MVTKQLKRALSPLFAAALLGACAVAPSSNTASSSPPGSPGASSASHTPPVPATMALAATEWTAFAIDGRAEVVNPKPKLRWLSIDKVAGTGGCNGFTGPSVARPGSLLIGPLASSGRACLSMPGSQEDMFFKALELTRKAKMERDQLVLTDESGKQLARFLKTN